MSKKEESPQLINERIVLAGMLLNLNPYFEQEFFQIVTPEYFSTPTTRRVYHAIMRCRADGKEINPTTVMEYLPIEYASIIGEWLADKSLVSPAQLQDALNMLRWSVLRTKMLNIASQIMGLRSKSVEEMSEEMDKLAQTIMETRNVYNERYYGSQTYYQAYLDTIERLEMVRKIKQLPVITGTKIDRYIVRLEPGHLNILAGRTSHGKTALAIQVVSNYLRRGEPVLFVSLEMTSPQLIMRLMSHDLRIGGRRLSGGWLKDEEMEQIQRYSEQVKGQPLILYDNPRTNMIDIINQVREFRRKYPVGGLVVVDYIQLINPVERRRNIKRHQEIGEIIKQLSEVAKQYEISVLGLAQLNRGAVEKKEPPRLHHLRESGDIEQGADKILFVWRPDKENVKKVEMDGQIYEGEELGSKAILILAKNRHGNTGRCITEFDGDYMEFRDYEPVQKEDAEAEEQDMPF